MVHSMYTITSIHTLIHKLGDILFQKQTIEWKSYSDFFIIPGQHQDHLPWILHNETSVCKQRARAARPWPNVKNCLTATWWRNDVEQFTDAISWWQRFVCVHLPADKTAWWQIPLCANFLSPLLPLQPLPLRDSLPYHKLPRSL